MTYNVILFALRDLWRLDILIWVAGVLLFFCGVLLLLFQLRQYRTLREERALLTSFHRHSVEYDLVMKVMKLAVWRVDLQSLTITIETDFRELVGRYHFPQNTPLQQFYDLMLPQYRSQVERSLKDLAEGRVSETHEQFQLHLPHSDKVFWEEVYATVEKRDMEGRPKVIVGTLMFIDRQKEIEHALIDARNHAEESDRLKSAFLANISHEIRTPLNAIVGFSEVLSVAQSDKERAELVHQIKHNNARLLRLFDDMVSVSKMEAGGQTVKMTTFSLTQLLVDVADKFADKSKETGVRIEIEKKTNPLRVHSDRNRLSTILNQYVDNAMKFTTKGSVTLGYTTTKGQLRIWVRDTGKGIPANYCDEHLFERFVKIDEFTPGTGLGLRICRTLALSIGGKVGLESQLGKGSVFWVEIPVGR